MLFRSSDLEAIISGDRTLAFRRWKRPTTGAGRTVRTQMGLIGIDSLEEIDPASLTEADATEAGYKSLASLLAMFEAQEGTCYRIRLHYAGPDTRPSIADNPELSSEDREKIRKRLQKLDETSKTGPWTAATLKAIAEHPAVVSTRLAEMLGRERFALKEDIRKLKALGLTKSLEVGYRLSPRGETWLRGA
jgi:biotin operon repressor